MSDGWDIAKASEEARRIKHQAYLKAFWKKPDARILLIANWLYNLEQEGHKGEVLRARTPGYQYRLIMQAHDRLETYEQVRRILEGE